MTLIIAITVLSGLLMSGCQSSDVKGTISLPKGQTAFEDTEVTIACVKKADDIPTEQTVVIPKGKSIAEFQIKGVQSNLDYYVRYTIHSKGGKGESYGSLDSTAPQQSNLLVGGLSIANHVFVKEGYWGQTGMTADVNLQKVAQKNELKPLALELIPEKGLQSKTNDILNKIITPGMSDYEKEKAIYNYVVLEIPNSLENLSNYLNNGIQEKENPLKEALENKSVVWMGQPFLMHWLLINAGVSSELVEEMTYAQNTSKVVVLVKLDDGYYYADPLMSSSKIGSNIPVLKAKGKPQQSIDQMTQHYCGLYFNYTDEYNLNASNRLFYVDGVQKKTGDPSQYEPLRKVLQKNKLTSDKVVAITCKVTLPKQIIAPKYGLWGSMLTETVMKPDASPNEGILINQNFVIEEGKSQKDFVVHVVDTGKPIKISYYEPRAKLSGEVIVPMPSTGPIQVEMNLSPLKE